MGIRSPRLRAWTSALSALALMPVFLLSTGCEEDDDDIMVDPDPATGTVVIQFDAAVAAQALELGEGHPGYTNAAGNLYWVSNLEYIVSDFELEAEAAARDGEGGFETGEDVLHYRTHSDETTRSFTLEDVPPGDYSHLHFRFGLSDGVNSPGEFPAMDTAGMAWPAMQGGGYHYMRHEGDFVNASTDTVGYTTHTGPTGGTDYSFEVELDLDLEGARHGFVVPADGTVTVTLEMNVNEWYDAPITYNFDDYGLIMGVAEAQGFLMANGAHEGGTALWSVKSVTTE